MSAIEWTNADAWYRRELSGGSYLVVSRMTLQRDALKDKAGRAYSAQWFWRQHSTATGELLDRGPRDKHSYASCYTAMKCADKAVTPPVVAVFEAVETAKAA